MFRTSSIMEQKIRSILLVYFFSFFCKLVRVDSEKKKSNFLHPEKLKDCLF